MPQSTQFSNKKSSLFKESFFLIDRALCGNYHVLFYEIGKLFGVEEIHYDLVQLLPQRQGKAG